MKYSNISEWIANPSLNTGTIDELLWEVVKCGFDDPSSQAMSKLLRGAGWVQVHRRRGRLWVAPGVDVRATSYTAAGYRAVIVAALRKVFAAHEADGEVMRSVVIRDLSGLHGVVFDEKGMAMRAVNMALTAVGKGSLSAWKMEPNCIETVVNGKKKSDYLYRHQSGWPEAQASTQANSSHNT